MTTSSATLQSDVDLFSEECMAAPYGTYQDLRRMGPVVYLPRHDVYAVARYAEAREVLGNWKQFSSADISLTQQFNEYIGQGVIRADPPVHDVLRGVLASRLSPRAIRSMRADIDARAAEMVDGLVARESFDAVRDLARKFPVEIVGDLIGLPEEGRADLLDLIDANFNCFGPMNGRTQASLGKLPKLAEYVLNTARKENLAAGSMGAAVFEAVDEGVVPAEAAPWLVMTYVTAGLDTTVHSISHLIWLLGTHQDQFERLRSDPALVPNAVRESIRYESPVQVFGRTVREEWTVGGGVLPQGARLAVLYGSGNRDEDKWPDADTFDVGRRNADHLGFGYGLHGCAGQALATLEGEAVLRALLASVERLEVGAPVRHYNNVLRGLESLPTSIVAC